MYLLAVALLMDLANLGQCPLKSPKRSLQGVAGFPQGGCWRWGTWVMIGVMTDAGWKQCGTAQRVNESLCPLCCLWKWGSSCC